MQDAIIHVVISKVFDYFAIKLFLGQKRRLSEAYSIKNCRVTSNGRSIFTEKIREPTGAIYLLFVVGSSLGFSLLSEQLNVSISGVFVAELVE